MSVCVQYPDDLIDNDDWDSWYWEWLVFEDVFDWMYDDEWTELPGWEEIIDQYLEDLLADASEAFWQQLFRRLASQPQALKPGLGWSGSTAEARFNALRNDSPTFNSMVTPFEQQSSANLTLFSIPSADFYVMAGQTSQTALQNAPKTFGNTFFDVYAFGGSTVSGADAVVNINTAIQDPNGNPITLNSTGYALALAHEVCHARFTLSLPLSDNYFKDYPNDGQTPETYQHTAMTQSDRALIEAVVREHVAANGITLQISNPPTGASYPANFDYVEMLSWNGLLETHAGMDYVMSYAQTVWGFSFTVGDKNNLTPTEQTNLVTYGRYIRDAIYGLVTP